MPLSKFGTTWGGCWIYSSFLFSSHPVLTKCPLHSQVPNVFPNMFPILPHFILYPLSLLWRANQCWAGIYGFRAGTYHGIDPGMWWLDQGELAQKISQDAILGQAVCLSYTSDALYLGRLSSILCNHLHSNDFMHFPFLYLYLGHSVSRFLNFKHRCKLETYHTLWKPYFFIDEISLKIKTQNQKFKNEVIFEGLKMPKLEGGRNG